jgi:ABC-type uncharacterized transport system substrate-binding protein
VKRREFLGALGGAAAWPLAARAQQASKLPTIGFMGSLTPSIQSERTDAFVKRLDQLSWVADRTVMIKYEWAEGHKERFAEIVAEFVRLNVDVIFVQGTDGVIAAKEATSVIPIVFVQVSDPVGSGVVASLARPGGNVTGLSNQNNDIAGKRIELLREVVPHLRRLAILVHAHNPGSVLEMQNAQTAARTLTLEVVKLEVEQAQDISPAVVTVKDRADALYVCGSELLSTNRTRISELALGAQLPTSFDSSEAVKAGGLMSYGPSGPDVFRRAAEMVDKILRGTKPADIPVEQPTKFELVINLRTAKALGLSVPQTLRSTADEVIE